MADDKPTSNYPRARGDGDARQVSMPIAAVGMLLSSVLAGGGGSFLTGRDVSQQMREGQLRLEARIDRLEETVRRAVEAQAASILRLETEGREREGRLRQLELWRAQVEARTAPR